MKLLRCLILFSLMVALLIPVIGRAEETPEPTEEIEATPEPTPTPLFGAAIGIDDAQRAERQKTHDTVLGASRAQGVYVADASDLSLCYFAKREHNTFRPGSTTKIMTALLTLENVPLDEIVTTPREATLLGGTNTMLGLAKNEQLRAEDMLYGLMLVSGNDCAIALAFHQAGSEEAFAVLMNERAEALGMVDTVFTNPCGRNVGDIHTSPYDLALLTQDALKNEEFLKIVGTVEYTIPANELRRKPEVIRNSNRLIADKPGKGYYYPYAIGVKTGATALGTCLVAAAKQEDVTIICVQMGMLGDDNAARRDELNKRAIQFFDYVFTYEYTHVKAETLIAESTQRIRVTNTSPFDAEHSYVTAKPDLSEATAYRPIREIDLLLAGNLAFSVKVDASATAPIQKGDRIGTVTYSLGGRVWFTVPLLADEDVDLPATPEPGTPIPVSEDTVSTPTPLPTEEPTPEPTPVAAPPRTTKTERWILPILAGMLLIAVAGVQIAKKIRERMP